MTPYAFDTPPWVHGLRKWLADEPSSWPELVYSIVRNGLGGTPRRKCETEKIESDAGLPPSCYWYVAQSEADYGFAIFVWKMPRSIEFGGMTPFDSGGYLSRKMKLKPADRTLSDEDHIKGFRQHDKRLEDWVNIFDDHVKNNHGGVDKYVEGMKPITPVSFGNVEHDIDSIPVDKRSWFVEARLPYGCDLSKLQPVAMFIDEPHANALYTWLKNKFHEKKGMDAFRVKRWIKDNRRALSETSGADARLDAFGAARNFLTRWSEVWSRP